MILGNIWNLPAREISKKYMENYHVNLDVSDISSELTEADVKNFVTLQGFL